MMRKCENCDCFVRDAPEANTLHKRKYSGTCYFDRPHITTFVVPGMDGKPKPGSMQARVQITDSREEFCGDWLPFRPRDE